MSTGIITGHAFSHTKFPFKWSPVVKMTSNTILFPICRYYFSIRFYYLPHLSYKLVQSITYERLGTTKAKIDLTTRQNSGGYLLFTTFFAYFPRQLHGSE